MCFHFLNSELFLVSEKNKSFLPHPFLLKVHSRELPKNKTFNKFQKLLQNRTMELTFALMKLFSLEFAVRQK